MLNRVFLFLFVLICCDNAVASEGKFTFIQQGKQAPFTGTLFDPTATAKIMANGKFLKEEYELKMGFEIQKQQKQFDLDISQLKITLDTERESFQKTLEVKNKEIEQLNRIIAKKPGTNALLWGIAGGFAVGVVATVGITYAVNK
jgi:phage-related protein